MYLCGKIRKKKSLSHRAKQRTMARCRTNQGENKGNAPKLWLRSITFFFDKNRRIRDHFVQPNYGNRREDIEKY